MFLNSSLSLPQPSGFVAFDGGGTVEVEVRRKPARLPSGRRAPTRARAAPRRRAGSRDRQWMDEVADLAAADEPLGAAHRGVRNRCARAATSFSVWSASSAGRERARVPHSIASGEGRESVQMRNLAQQQGQASRARMNHGQGTLLPGNLGAPGARCLAHRRLMPTLNEGEAAVLYCFVFLFLSIAGAGTWSIDSMRKSEPTARQPTPAWK